MARRSDPWLGLAAVASLAGCVEPESGGGYDSTGEASEMLASSGTPQDSGLDDTGVVPPFVPPAEHSYFIAESDVQSTCSSRSKSPRSSLHVT